MADFKFNDGGRSKDVKSAAAYFNCYSFNDDHPAKDYEYTAEEVIEFANDYFLFMLKNMPGVDRGNYTASEENIIVTGKDIQQLKDAIKAKDTIINELFAKIRNSKEV